jgi:sensor c-di-GMP phosphodiesterase-like protein
MQAIANVFINGRYPKLVLAVTWAGLLAVLLLTGYGFVVLQVTSQLNRSNDAELARLGEIRSNVVGALQRLEREAVSAPCSRGFLAQMQTIAFLPDGLNEFLYAPNHVVKCSTSQPKFEQTVVLGRPDIRGAAPGDPDL